MNTQVKNHLQNTLRDAEAMLTRLLRPWAGIQPEIQDYARHRARQEGRKAQIILTLEDIPHQHINLNPIPKHHE